MSKKTSPQSRPTRRPRTRGPQQVRSGGTTASAGARSVGRAGRSDRKDSSPREAPAPTTFRGRLRRYLPTALIPNIVAVLSVIVVALAVVLLASLEMAALPATIAQFWLILNLVPVTFDGVTVGMLPMLPAIGLVWLVSRQIRRAVRHRVSVADLGVLLLGALAVPLILTGIAAAMLWDASAVYAVTPPDLVSVLARVLLLHLVALVIGMGAKLWRALLRRYGLPAGLVDTARTAVRWLRYMGLASLVVLIAAVLLSWRRQAELAELYNSAGALVALGFVSLLYLPNALIGVIAVLVGAEFHIGGASVSLFSIHHTPLPPLPLTGAIPAESQVWFPVLLVIPAALAVYLAYRGNPTLLSAVATALSAGVLILVLGYLSQGDLGAFGQSGPMVLLSAGLTFVWLGLGRAATVLLLKVAERRHARQLRPTAEGPAAAGATAASADEVAGDEEETAPAQESDADSGDPGDGDDTGDGDDAESVDTAAEDSEPEDDDAAGETTDSSGADDPDAGGPEDHPTEEGTEEGTEEDGEESPEDTAAADSADDADEGTGQDAGPVAEDTAAADSADDADEGTGQDAGPVAEDDDVADDDAGEAEGERENRGS